MRLFLGIELPDEVKEKIAREAQALKKNNKGWENPLDYHLTLLFIGETSTEDLPRIKELLSQIHSKPFELTLEDFFFFNRRVFYLGVKPSSELHLIRNQMIELFPEWISQETKEFIPHVTLKRWQRYEYDELALSLSVRPKFFVSFDVKRLALFKSEKDENGQKYHVIDSKDF